MKKSILVFAAAATFTLIGTQAFACYWDGYWSGPMGGPMAGVQGNGKYQEFYEKTASLRQDLAGKQGEYNALLATSTPDPKRAAELNREITVLHDQLSAKARSFNLPGSNMRHYARMDGHGMSGHGMGCW
jgi:zinc resistance-associated protein